MSEQEKSLEERRKLQEESLNEFRDVLGDAVIKFFLDRGSRPVSMLGCLLALLETLVIMIDASTTDLGTRLKVWDAVLEDLANKRKVIAKGYQIMDGTGPLPPKEEMN